MIALNDFVAACAVLVERLELPVRVAIVNAEHVDIALELLRARTIGGFISITTDDDDEVSVVEHYTSSPELFASLEMVVSEAAGEFRCGASRIQRGAPS